MSARADCAELSGSALVVRQAPVHTGHAVVLPGPRGYPVTWVGSTPQYVCD